MTNEKYAHTPGPWHWEEKEDGFYLMSIDGYCILFADRKSNGLPVVENMSLIADAPNLLAEIKKLREGREGIKK